MSPNPVTTRERLSSPLTWHYVGLGVMVLLVLGLAIRLGNGLVRHRLQFH